MGPPALAFREGPAPHEPILFASSHHRTSRAQVRLLPDGERQQSDWNRSAVVGVLVGNSVGDYDTQARNWVCKSLFFGSSKSLLFVLHLLSRVVDSSAISFRRNFHRAAS